MSNPQMDADWRRLGAGLAKWEVDCPFRIGCYLMGVTELRMLTGYVVANGALTVNQIKRLLHCGYAPAKDILAWVTLRIEAAHKAEIEPKRVRLTAWYIDVKLGHEWPSGTILERTSSGQYAAPGTPLGSICLAGLHLLKGHYEILEP